jgi:hypothetical protein|tara:strand:- start:226 stop:630 length:405 start_codon:yes stop_codon:yes gene_type:complete
MGDISIKGRSPLLKGGRVGLKRGGGSAPWLRGRSGQTIKAPRGREGWKQMKDYEAKIPKGKKGIKALEAKIERAGPKEQKVILKDIMGGGRGRPKGGSTKERRRLARVEDAMREKLLGSLGPKGRISNRKGGKA